MKMYWKLKAIEDPGYDCFNGWVIAAPDEKQARQIAQDASYGDEVLNSYRSDPKQPFWDDPEQSTCVPLDDLPEGVILSSFKAG